MPFNTRHLSSDDGGEGPSAAAGKMPKQDHRTSHNPGGTRKRDAHEKYSVKLEFAGKNGSGGGSKVARKEKEKKKKAPDHPLAEEFIESLDNSTGSITASLVESISNIHMIGLSRIAAATSLSQTYIDSANSSAEKFSRLSILSDSFRRELAANRAFVAARQNDIDRLRRDYTDITGEILQLQREALAISPTKGLTHEDPLAYEEFGDGVATDEAFLEAADGRCREVERKWIERMQQSERKFENDAIKRRQLAITVMV